MNVTTSHINTLLAQEDIEGLIEAGAPIDEYNDEAAHIAAALSLLESNDVTKEVALSTVTLVWVKNFELSEQDVKLRLSAFDRVAEAIVS